MLRRQEAAREFSGYDLYAIIDNYTRQIQHNNVSALSIEHASYWFDNMTLYLDMLSEKQDELWWDLVLQIEKHARCAIPGIFASVFVIIITALASLTMIGVVYMCVSGFPCGQRRNIFNTTKGPISLYRLCQFV